MSSTSTGSTSVLAQIKDRIDEIVQSRSTPCHLVRFLDERSDVYCGCTSRESERIKSYALAAFEDVTLPEEALPFVLEELELGHHPRLLAAAAIAMRSYPTKRPDFCHYLVTAFQNLNGHDDRISFEEILPEFQVFETTTAQDELCAAFRWLGDSASGAKSSIKDLANQSWNGLAQRTRFELLEIAGQLESVAEPKTRTCCTPSRPSKNKRAKASKNKYSDIQFQDQDGVTKTFGECVGGKATILAFFYTRCENPRKCALTMSKLAVVQGILMRSGVGAEVNITAVTYDPSYDIPHRMRVFANDHGLELGNNCNVLRAVDRHDEFIEAFDVQVNYADSIVNHHAIELLLLNKEGKLATVYSRIQWQPEDVAERVETLVTQPLSQGRSRSGRLEYLCAFGSATLIAIMPKCPLCWAAYLSFFGITTTQGFLSQKFVLGLALMLLAVFLAVVGWRCWLANLRLPFAISLLGAIGLVAAMPLDLHWLFRGVSLTLLMLGSFLSSNIHWKRNRTENN